jgi:hypothetical protein
MSATLAATSNALQAAGAAPGLLAGSPPRAIAGGQYDTHVVVRFPPWPGYAFLNTLVFPGAMKARGSDWRIDSIAFGDPESLADAQALGTLPFKIPGDFAAGRARPWLITVRWTKTGDTLDLSPSGAGSTDLLVKALIGAAFVGLGFLTIRSFTFAVRDSATGLKQTLFNPGFILAAVLVVALFMRRGR